MARRRERTRAEILAAAWELCREQGLAGLSLRELAARVGLRAPSLYSYFPSKDAIYDAMFAEGQRALLARFETAAVDRPGRRWLHATARDFVEFCTEDPVRYQLMFQRVVPGFEPSAASYALAVRVLELARDELARLGVTDQRLLDLWTALLTGLTDQQLSNDPGGDRWVRLLDEAVEMFCDRAGVPPETSPATDSRGPHPS